MMRNSRRKEFGEGLSLPEKSIPHVHCGEPLVHHPISFAGLGEARSGLAPLRKNLFNPSRMLGRSTTSQADLNHALGDYLAQNAIQLGAVALPGVAVYHPLASAHAHRTGGGGVLQYAGDRCRQGGHVALGVERAL